ncbi:hypothetical protein JR064_09015 [Xanthomonas sp. CFBP 8703]|uniref:Uncharacterized protein n=1 Tax=Xanthomonas bonasiae TaxID=2810351 RepID=A0ABS3B1V2_9XANT|nr:MULTISPECIES: hypothetical protein [Xanthomonas]MBN6102303.1 hypothetical protein [Xanthomonas bonasiae]NYF21996.1 hypothetical protein [Xanthomonas sp. JAI131]
MHARNRGDGCVETEWFGQPHTGAARARLAAAVDSALRRCAYGIEEEISMSLS